MYNINLFQYMFTTVCEMRIKCRYHYMRLSLNFDDRILYEIHKMGFINFVDIMQNIIT